jgi:hypothetical protein
MVIIEDCFIGLIPIFQDTILFNTFVKDALRAD